MLHLRNMNRIKYFWIFILLFPTIRAQNSESALWINDCRPDEKDYHVAFRGEIRLEKESVVTLNLLASSWFTVWVNGVYFTEGPSRYHISYPEYQTHELTLPKGRNIVAVQVHQEGVETRMLKVIPPFFWCEAIVDGNPLRPDWKATRLKGYLSQFRRINAQLGWVEWLDTRLTEQDWMQPTFDNGKWETPESVTPRIGNVKPLSTANVRHFPVKPKIIGKGVFAETFGYEHDNISARFFLRDLQCKDNPPQGIWIRYDLGRVRLIRPKFTLDLPAGAVVEFAYSETLNNGRVTPWITLSTSDSYNMDHFTARGGVQEFFPLTPKGGRFAEIHIIAPPEQIKIIDETFIERCYYGDIDGSFRTNDELLNRIWQVGAETFKACSEDAVVDNPTRERGQWMDIPYLGVEIGAAAFSDVALVGRTLRQSAQCASPGGLVAGMCPGGDIYVASFALQWVSGCLNYWRLTGDKTILIDLFDGARKNLDYMFTHTSADGLTDKAGWAFIDWGYVRNDGPVDIGLNLHYSAALRDMARWCDVLGKTREAVFYRQKENDINLIIRAWYDRHSTNGHYDFGTIGYHRTVLGLTNGFFDRKSETEAVEYIKKHILNCFPEKVDAPRLSDPGNADKQLITPYFFHFALSLLIEKGETDFVLDRYRKCWGWMLEDDRTTWIEVFDTRWSHCHHWSGCPTWQLTRYMLGLKNRFDIKECTFDFQLNPGSLNEAEGKIPITGTGKVVRINWKKENGIITYRAKTEIPITINIPKDKRYSKSGTVKVTDELILKMNNPRAEPRGIKTKGFFCFRPRGSGY